MKKIIYFICCITIAVLLIGCSGKKSSGTTDSSALAGTWNGCGNALGKDRDFRCENLSLHISENGSFILTDIEQGTDLFSGTFSISAKENISIASDKDSQNQLPKGWETFTEKEHLHFQMPDSEHLILTYKDTSYYFEKENISAADKAATTVSPLLDIAENDIWYTSESPDSDYIYELALYDKYAELYSLKADDNSKGTFITNFLYYSNNGNTFSFYTYKDNAMKLPTMFQTLPNGISKIDIQLSASNESLSMQYNGQALSFYNHVIYGLNTSSTSYYLNNTCFYWIFDKTSHFCYFTAEQDTGDLYLYITDGRQNEAKINTIRGQIVVDEADKALIFNFDKAASKKTADKKSALYQTFKNFDKDNTNGLRIRFKLKDSQLTLKTKKIFGKNYTFTLTDYPGAE